MQRFVHNPQLSSPPQSIKTPERDQKKDPYVPNPANCSHGDFFWDNDEIVIFSCLTQPIIVSFNRKSYYHTIWVIRHDQKEINKRLNNKQDKPDKDNTALFNPNSSDSDEADDDNDKIIHSSFLHSRSNIKFTPNDNDLQNDHQHIAPHTTQVLQNEFIKCSYFALN